MGLSIKISIRVRPLAGVPVGINSGLIDMSSVK
jgi:hypothetical protein